MTGTGTMRTTATHAAPFHVFVLVCDREKAVGVRAALAFQKILSRRPRGASPEFMEMLAYCREHFSSLWQEYASSKAEVDLAGFVELLGRLEGSRPPPVFEALERDLAKLASRLFRAGFLLRPRPEQDRAYEEFRRALRERSLPRDAGPEAKERASPPIEDRPVAVESAPHDAPAGPQTDPASPREPAPLSPLPSPGAAWVRGPLRLVCTKIRDEARDVRTYSFMSADGRWFHYRPGQFVTIEPVIGGKRVPRPYTISSAPTRPALLEITVKRILGGVVSNWLHDHMSIGQELDARGPFGKFSCLEVPSEKYLLLGAGSGVTPLMSMLRYLHDVAASVDLVFFQSAKTELDLVFREELGLVAESDPRFRIVLTLTDPPAESAWDGLRGRLDNAMLHEIAPDLPDRMVLACGPAGFLEKVKSLLAGNGFPLDTQFDEESFVPRLPAGPVVSADARSAGTSRTVRFVRSGRTAEILAGETILDAAERCGLSIPSACRQGRCGTCRVVRISGDVTMPEQEALSLDAVGEGEILACIGQPASGTIEVDL